MKRSALVLVTAAVAAVGLAVATAVVPGLSPRSLANPVIEGLGGVTCDDERCPPDADWVRPVEAPVTSGFRSPERPDHHGVDLAGAYGTPVVAASAGLVLAAKCQAILHDEPYGCDRDGSWEVRGCGWYVKVLHAHHVATLYCHLRDEPAVSAGDTVDPGDLIGVVGSSGNSSEPHLHFEVQRGSTLDPPRSTLATDPQQFMAEREAALITG